MIIKVTPKSRKEDSMQPKPMTKLLKTLLLVVLVVFSMDFGSVKYKSLQHKITIKLCSLSAIALISSSFYFVAYYTKMHYIFLIMYSKYIIQIYAFILVLLLIPEDKTFYTFLENLNSIDVELSVDSNSFHLDIKLLMYCMTIMMFKAMASIIYCTGPQHYECVKPAWIQVIYGITYYSMDIPLVFLCFIFYAARVRLTILRKVIESRRCKPIRHLQHLYKSLIEYTENVKEAFDPIFIITLLFEVPTLMGIIYTIIKEITIQSKTLTGYSTEILVAFLSMLILFAPAVAAGCLASEVNKIKISLFNVILETEDPQKVRDVQKFINYVEARPFKFRVLGIIPLDATLPMIILNLYVTYIIVLLQLTHLY